MTVAPEQVLAAHGDAWEAEGVLRRPYGGDAAALPGVRLMSSGVPHPQWNSGDVDDPDVVDVDAVRSWYAGRADVWGLRVPAGTPWPLGRHVVSKPLWARTLGPSPTVSAVAGLELRAAGPKDLDVVVAVDSAAFGSDPAQEAPWMAPHLLGAPCEVLLGLVDGVPAATGYSVLTDGRAGPAVHLGGICVLPAYEGRGIGTALTVELLDRAAARGAALAHLEPDTDRAAAVYARLGFVPAAGLDIYVFDAVDGRADGPGSAVRA